MQLSTSRECGPARVRRAGASRRHGLRRKPQAQYFYVDFNDYAGSLSDVKASIIWQATPRFGVGLGYNDFRFRFKLDKDDFSGRLRWNYGGAIAFVSVMF